MENISDLMKRYAASSPGLGRSQLAERIVDEVLPKVREALERWAEWRGINDDGPCETFERIAAAFRRDTGLMAPGKSAGAGDYGSEDIDKRRAEWEAWNDKQIEEMDAMLRTTIALLDGGTTK